MELTESEKQDFSLIQYEILNGKFRIKELPESLKPIFANSNGEIDYGKLACGLLLFNG